MYRVERVFASSFASAVVALFLLLAADVELLAAPSAVANSPAENIGLPEGSRAESARPQQAQDPGQTMPESEETERQVQSKTTEQESRPKPVIVPSPPRRHPAGTPPETTPAEPTVVVNEPRSAESPSPTPAPIQSDTVTLPEGTAIPVRLTQEISTKTAQTGDRFEAIVDRDLEVDGRRVVPRGSPVLGRLEIVRPGGKVKGRAELSLRLEEIEIGGESYPIVTSDLGVRAGPSKAQDAKKIGVAAGIGAIVGAIAGGGKGAAIGATIGGAGGTAGVLTSRGKAARLEKEQLITFRLSHDLQVNLQR